jgi:ATP-dependent Clp protease ATP-binding subunit ClpA
MPFLNDVIEQNKENLAQQKYQQDGLQQRISTSIRQSRFVFEPSNVMALLHERIIGQPAALLEIENMLNVVKADFSNPERPLSVTLMLGSTGVGKTETVRLISEAIYGRPDAFCRIDMNTLAQEHYAAALTGAPPGYVGSKEGSTLFDIEAIQGSFSKPGIVLFDELEKASKEVVRSLLNVLDSGKLTLSSGAKSIDFRNSMIFMTSNVGAKDLYQHWKKPVRSLKNLLKTRATIEKELIDDALHRQFDPEFLNHIDRTLCYQRVGQNFMPELIEIELKKLNSRLAKQGRNVALHSSVIRYLSTGYDLRFGARDLARKFRTQLEPALATFVINNPMSLSLSVSVSRQHFIVEGLPT